MAVYSIILLPNEKRSQFFSNAFITIQGEKKLLHNVVILNQYQFLFKEKHYFIQSEK